MIEIRKSVYGIAAGVFALCCLVFFLNKNFNQKPEGLVDCAFLEENMQIHADPFNKESNPNGHDDVVWKWKKNGSIGVNISILARLKSLSAADGFIPYEPKYAFAITGQECILVSENGPTMQLWSYKKVDSFFIMIKCDKIIAEYDAWLYLNKKIQQSKSRKVDNCR